MFYLTVWTLKCGKTALWIQSNNHSLHLQHVPFRLRQNIPLKPADGLRIVHIFFPVTLRPTTPLTSSLPKTAWHWLTQAKKKKKRLRCDEKFSPSGTECRGRRAGSDRTVTQTCPAQLSFHILPNTLRLKTYIFSVYTHIIFKHINKNLSMGAHKKSNTVLNQILESRFVLELSAIIPPHYHFSRVSTENKVLSLKYWMNWLVKMSGLMFLWFSICLSFHSVLVTSQIPRLPLQPSGCFSKLRWVH